MKEENMPQKSANDTSPFALIAVGGLSLDQGAMRLVASVVSALEMEPVLLHVIKPGGEAETGEQYLEKARDMLGIPSAETLLKEGTVAGEIQAELDRRNYRLLVLETGGVSPGHPSTQLSQKLANRVSLSVLLVRPPAGEIKRMLICTSGSPISDGLIRWGLKLAKVTSAQPTVLHVASAAPEMYAGLPMLTEDLSNLLSRDTPLSSHLKEVAVLAESLGVDAQLELRHGLVAEEITRACDMQDYDFIVIGAAKSPKLVDGWLIDKVTPLVLPSITCSILVVRTDIE
jgi:nucleotide-binding universal stress UspA family protein